MTDVWLVRHGEAAASWEQEPDPGLSTLGQAQALDAAHELAGYVPDDALLMTSPKARARETGQPFADLRGQSLVVASEFIEVQAPVPLDQRKTWLRSFMQQGWSEQPASLWAWREAIVSRLIRCQQPTVVFTHFLVINALMAHIDSSDAVLQCWPDNGSIHQFRSDASGLSLVSAGKSMETSVT